MFGRQLTSVLQPIAKTKAFIMCKNHLLRCKNAILRKKHFFLDGIWYIFIIVFLGQLGPIIGYASAFWNDGDVLAEISKSAGKADLITCATAILAGGTFFLIKEYNSSDQINQRGVKSIIILLTSLIGLVCIGIAATLLAKNGFESKKQEILHWTFYGLALTMAFFLWIFDELQGSAKEAIKIIADDSKNITDQSKKTSEIDGIRI